jgi:hypothetical protein
MKRKQLTEEQIIGILKEAEAGGVNRPGFVGGSNS